MLIINQENKTISGAARVGDIKKKGLIAASMEDKNGIRKTRKWDGILES